MNYVGGFTFNCCRFLVGGFVLIPCIFFLRKVNGTQLEELSVADRRSRRRVGLTGGICCGIFICIASSLQQFGIAYTTVGKAGFITALYIVIVSYTHLLNLGTAEDRLYSKFVVAVFDGQKYTKVSNTAYVTNPEAVAKHTDPYKNAQTKKGLLIENTDSMVADAFELGVNHVIVNIPFHHILGEGINYEYDGKTYSFNKALMEQYDSTIRKMSEKSMTVTAVILNGWNDSTPQLVYPGVTKQPENQVFYYGFNASTQEGYETIKAIASFLADRYSSLRSPYGKVSNWIIGNEINNQQWNYMGDMPIDQYVHEYERAFRVFYTAIKLSLIHI